MPVLVRSLEQGSGAQEKISGFLDEVIERCIAYARTKNEEKIANKPVVHGASRFARVPSIAIDSLKNSTSLVKAAILRLPIELGGMKTTESRKSDLQLSAEDVFLVGSMVCSSCVLRIVCFSPSQYTCRSSRRRIKSAGSFC